MGEIARKSEIILYQTEDGKTKLEVRLEHESIWLTQAAMAELFQTTPQNITLHLKEIYNTGELPQEATCKENLQVQTEGGRRVSRTRKFYNLPTILTKFLSASGIYARARNAFIRKFGIFINWLLIMTRRPKKPWNSLGSFRINCILLFPEKQRQN